jgi:hypothetical protein
METEGKNFQMIVPCYKFPRHHHLRTEIKSFKLIRMSPPSFPRPVNITPYLWSVI